MDERAKERALFVLFTLEPRGDVTVQNMGGRKRSLGLFLFFFLPPGGEDGTQKLRLKIGIEVIDWPRTKLGRVGFE